MGVEVGEGGNQKERKKEGERSRKEEEEYFRGERNCEKMPFQIPILSMRLLMRRFIGYGHVFEVCSKLWIDIVAF